MKQLRQYIRQVLLTEGLKFDQDLLLFSSGTATKSGRFLLLCGGLEEYWKWDLDDEDEFEAFYDLHVKAMVKLVKPHHECNGSLEISLAAAREGYGPTIYDIAMELSPNGIINDRGSVSEDSKEVMVFYKNKRTDVDKKLLDNIKDPKTFPRTSDTSDDCKPGNQRSYVDGIARIHQTQVRWEDDELSYSYNKPMSSKVQEFMLKGDKFKKASNLDDITIVDLAETLFADLY